MSESEKIHVVNFVSGINQKSVAQLVEFTTEARNCKASKIILNISSTGGELTSAFGTYYHLRSLGIPLVTHNMGNVESAAVLIYLAGDTRLAAPHCRFLIHKLRWQFANETVTQSFISEKLMNIEFDTARYRDIFNERTQGAESPIDIDKALMGDSAFLSARDALSAGICTCISELAVAADAILWHISFPFVS